MSTTFQVYKPPTVAPTFTEVLELSNRYLREALHKNGIGTEFLIGVKILSKDANVPVNFNKADCAVWDEDSYAWFTISGVAGGCDAYCDTVDELDKEILEDLAQEIQEKENARPGENLIRDCKNGEFYWSFRRSVGQPYIINLSYGLIAAAFTKLTEGIIYSCDSAWDYTIFPAIADDFLASYFNPDWPDPEWADWAKENFDGICKLYTAD